MIDDVPKIEQDQKKFDSEESVIILPTCCWRQPVTHLECPPDQNLGNRKKHLIIVSERVLAFTKNLKIFKNLIPKISQYSTMKNFDARIKPNSNSMICHRMIWVENRHIKQDMNKRRIVSTNFSANEQFLF